MKPIKKLESFDSFISEKKKEEEKVNEDWNDEDNKKLKQQDAKDFSCTQEHEIEYLILKLRVVKSSLKRDEIKTAIELCCKELGAPYPRKEFENCVRKRLGLPPLP